MKLSTMTKNKLLANFWHISKNTDEILNNPRLIQGYKLTDMKPNDIGNWIGEKGMIEIKDYYQKQGLNRPIFCLQYFYSVYQTGKTIGQYLGIEK